MSFAWDLDGDSNFDGHTGASGSHTFSSLGRTEVRVRVTDDDGGSAVQSVFIDVVPEPSTALLVSIGLVGLAWRRSGS